MSPSRQLAAIMFTDIVGFTALMGSDEKKTFDILEKNRKIHKPIISEYNGRWIKELGDGVMASFSLVSDAVHAAIKIMETCNAANEYQLCIGIHLAEVVFENDDVFGDGVNIAARIQSAAAPGCIFISESVHRSISNNTDIETRFAKEAILKNVSLPIRMYQVMVAGGKIFVPGIPATAVVQKSIAVLPFVNMSSDPEQEFFSDGISEDIINDLAQVSELKVIGRTSSFAFKGKNLDLKIIGEQLKVSHILEGSVRKSGNKLRVTAQLISVADGFHLYSEKFDRELEDIFAIQDEISLAILNAIKIKLFGAEKDAVLKRYTENVEAYQLYLNGRFHVNKFTPDGFFKAIEYFQAAIAIDPDYAIAYSGLSFSYMNLGHQNWSSPDKSLLLAIQCANKSLELDDEIAESHLAVGRVKMHCELKVREAEIEYKKALAINPNSAEVYAQLGFCTITLGKNQEAIEHAIKAESLDPFSLLNLYYLGVPYWGVGDFEKNLALGKRLIDLEPYFPGGYFWVGHSYLFSKRYEDAIPALEMAVKLYPDLQNLSALGGCYGLMGNKMKAMEIIEQMKKIEGSDITGNLLIGWVYGSIGEWDTAFRYFDQAIENHDFRMNFLKFYLLEIQMDMKDPRAMQLFERLDLPYE